LAIAALGYSGPWLWRAVTVKTRARVNVKEAGVQTPGSTVFVVWNARDFDFWRMNRRTYFTFRYARSRGHRGARGA